MKEAVTKVIDTLTQEDFVGVFQKLLERYNKCIVAGGDYFEENYSFMCVLSIKVPIRKKNLETYLMILVCTLIYWRSRRGQCFPQLALVYVIGHSSWAGVFARSTRSSAQFASVINILFIYM